MRKNKWLDAARVLRQRQEAAREAEEAARKAREIQERNAKLTTLAPYIEALCAFLESDEGEAACKLLAASDSEIVLAYEEDDGGRLYSGVHLARHGLYHYFDANIGSFASIDNPPEKKPISVEEAVLFVLRTGGDAEKTMSRIRAELDKIAETVRREIS